MKTLSKIYKKYPNFVEAIRSRNKRYNDTVEKIISLENDKRILVVRPSKRIKIKRIEKRKEVIQEQYDLGVSDSMFMLDEIKKYLSI